MTALLCLATLPTIIALGMCWLERQSWRGEQPEPEIPWASEALMVHTAQALRLVEHRADVVPFPTQRRGSEWS